MMQPRRFLSYTTRVVLLAAVMAMPAAPARADILGDMLAKLAGPLAAVVGGLNTLQTILMAVETRLPAMIKTVEMKQREKLAQARDAAAKTAAQRRADINSLHESKTGGETGACEVVTGGSDLAKIESTNLPAIQSSVRQAISNASEGLPGEKDYNSGAKVSLDPAKRAADNFKNHAALYATPNEAAMAAKLTGKSVAQINANPYAGADKAADTLLGTDSFNEDKHAVAAMNYCQALTGNSSIPYAQGRALAEHIDNIQQFNRALGDYATQSIGQFFCTDPIGRKMPVDQKFPSPTPELVSTLTNFNSYGTTVGSADQARKVSDIDVRTRSYLMDPQGGGYVEGPSEPKTTGQPSLGAQHKLIKNQMVSAEQVDEAEFIYKWGSASMNNKFEGSLNMNMANMYTRRLYKSKLLWRQYEQAEHELLLETVALARMTRQQMSDPGAVSPH